MSSAPASTAPADEYNPYLGPAPFGAGVTLYGRDRERRELANLLIAERVVVLHSPSGAGKTSLIEAAIIPTFESEGFEVIGPLRVNGVPPDELKVSNPYVWSVICGIDGGIASTPEGANITLTEVLDRKINGDTAEDQAPSRNQLFIFDQFEEVLILDPTDRGRQEEFFSQLGRALANVHRWALLSMREDFMGGLARYATLIPSHLTVRYRLDFLDRDQAREAMVEPAREGHVDFTREAADALVDDLAKVNVQRPGQSEPTKVPGPYVEPVHLQVVCNRLWRQLTKKLGGDFETIEVEQVAAFADPDRALSNYYGDAVTEIAGDATRERIIRDWFEDGLITKEGFRSQIGAGPKLDDADVVLDALASCYLIRAETRGGTTWYELTHDRLVRPVLKNNKKWRRKTLDRWEYEAVRWQRSGRDGTYLLDGLELRSAKRWMKHLDREPDPSVPEFIRASQEHQGRNLAAVFGLAAAVLFWVALVELAIILLMLIKP